MASGSSKAISSAFIQILPNFSGFAKALGSGFDLAFGSAAITVSESFDKVGKSIFKKFSLPLIIATGANIAQFQALEREVNTVMTLFGTAGVKAVEKFDELSEGVRGVASEVGGLEKDIAGGLYQAISAGVPEDNVFEFLEVAQMAAMADKTSDLTTAVDGITTAVNAFSGESLTAARASDIMFAGVAAGKTTFGELGSSIGRAAGLAANAGVHFDEFTAVIAEMTKSGIKTSEAVSYMRASITSLLRPSEEMDAIFQEIGFSTAEAAVPVIGLQASFQALVDATGGSTSKLQELLGSAEAVSTVLAVTGENADSFSQTLKTMETSAGSTERAYEIMERGIGRSFGRLTEGFDQLGNMFGEMGSVIVKPVVDALGDLVGAMVTVFSSLKPLAITVGKLVGSFVDVIDTPVLGHFVKGITALALALSGLLGFLGPVIIMISKIIRWRVYSTVVAGLTKKFVKLRKDTIALNKQLAAGGPIARAFGKGVDALANSFNWLVLKLRSTALAVVASFAFVAVAVAAIYGLVKAFTMLRESQEEAAKQNDIFGYGVATAMENAGITVSKISPAYEGVTQAAAGTRIENALLIAELKELSASVGDVGAADTLVQFGVSMIWQGATPQEAFDIAQEIARSQGLELPVTVEGLEAASMDISLLGDGVTALGEQLVNWNAELAQTYEGNDWAQAATADTVALSDALAQMFVAASKQGKIGEFMTIFEGIEEQVGDAVLMDEIIDQMALGVEKLSDDAKFGFDINGALQDTSSFMDVMDEAIGLKDELAGTVNVGIDTDLARDTAAEESMASLLESIRNAPPEIEGVVRLTGDQGVALQQMIKDTDAVFQAALDSITNAQAEITSGLESQIPLFGGYTAAVELTKAALQKSSDAWQTDVDLIASRTQVLQDNLSQDEIDIFNQKGVAEQAAFLMGDIDDVVEKLGIFKDTAASMDELAGIKIDESMGTIMADAQTVLDEGITGLITASEAAGSEVAAAYINKFESANGAPTWGPSAQTYMDEVEDVIGAEIAGPVITAPTFIGGSTTYTINVSASNSPSPGKDVSRALQHVNEFNR